MSSVGRSQSVKIVIINTKYVETDAMSFKDVVQRLTGKDSRVAYEVQEPVTKSPKYFLKEEINGRTSNNVMESSNTSITSTMSRDNSSFLMRNISFKEFERLFREMPPVEEFWAENYGVDPLATISFAPSCATEDLGTKPTGDDLLLLNLHVFVILG